MQPSSHATGLLHAITNGQSNELEQLLARAAAECRSAGPVTRFEQESWELLEACVQALQSHAVTSPRGKAAGQILLHLAENAEAEKLMLSLAPGSYRSPAGVSSHR